jgi:hypothetical protein
MRTKSATFIDPAIQAQYNDWGFAHIKGILNSQELNELMRHFKEHYEYDGKPNTMWNSLCDIPHDRSAVLSDQILSIVRPRLEEHLKDFVCPAATFLVKNPTQQSTVPLHRDFSVQDEPDFSYQNIWLPLVDTTPANGQLRVLRRSHRFFDYPLPQHAPWPYTEHEDLLLEYCDVIDAKAGDVVIYSDKVLHGSASNTTQEARPIVHFGLLHPDAKLLYYYLDRAVHEVTVYEVNYEFFFENAWGPQGDRFPILRKFSYEPPAKTAAEVREWLEHEVLSNGVTA